MIAAGLKGLSVMLQEHETFFMSKCDGHNVPCNECMYVMHTLFFSDHSAELN